MLFQNGQKIIFTGDSITDSNRKRPVGEGLWEGVGGGYVRQVDTLLNVLYPEMLFHIVNTGWSGNTSRDLMERFDRDVLDLNPDWVFMMIGANDVWRQFDEPGMTSTHVGLAEYTQNVSQMVKKVLAKGKKIICMTPYYMERNKQDPMRIRMDEYGLAMKRVCEANGVPCIDTQAIFDDYLRYRHPCYLSWDHVHAGHIGSMLLAKTILASIGVDRALY